MSNQRPIDLPRLEQIMKERREAVSLLLDIAPNLNDDDHTKVCDFLQKVIDEYKAFHEAPEEEGMPKMAMINGQSYRCEVCHANVFTVYPSSPNRWHCNGCQAEYIGE